MRTSTLIDLGLQGIAFIFLLLAVVAFVGYVPGGGAHHPHIKHAVLFFACALLTVIGLRFRRNAT